MSKLHTTGYQIEVDKNVVKKFDCSVEFTSENFFDIKFFTNELLKYLNEENRYSIISRIGYITNLNDKYNVEWKMLGSQNGVAVDSYEEMETLIQKIHGKMCDVLENSMDYYKYNIYDVVIIQVLIYYIGDKLPKRIINFNSKSLGENKDLLQIKKISDGFNKYIPLIYNNEDLGVLLLNKIDNDSITTIVLIDGTVINILDFINKHLITKKVKMVSSKISFYQKKIGTFYVIVSVEKNDDRTIFNIYSLQGLHLETIVDKYIGISTYVRQVGNVKGYINKKGLYKKEIVTKFNHVYLRDLKGKISRMLHPEWRIGVLDLEAYTIGQTAKTYAIGFYTKNNIKTFYIDSNLNSDNLIIKCLDNMLIDKYNGYSFYVHNWTKYDVYFIFRVVVMLNRLHPEIYTFEPKIRDSDIIGLRISRKVNKNNYTIHILDSYNILQSSLDNLARTFNTEIQKSFFPHKFVTKNTIFYKGVKPAKKYYVNDSFKYKGNDLVDVKENDYDLKGNLKTDLYNKIPNKIEI